MKPLARTLVILLLFALLTGACSIIKKDSNFGSKDSADSATHPGPAPASPPTVQGAQPGPGAQSPGAQSPVAQSPASQSPGAKIIHIDPDYRISLKYPAGWRFTEGYGVRYEGTDGFFQLGAMGLGTEGREGPPAGVELTVMEAAQNEAEHKLNPYGSKPRLEKMQVDGHEAVLIIPSEDQSMKGQWGLIAEYPEPVTISGQTYPYLILWAHGDHIRDIAGTISFQR